MVDLSGSRDETKSIRVCVCVCPQTHEWMDHFGAFFPFLTYSRE